MYIIKEGNIELGRIVKVGGKLYVMDRRNQLIMTILEDEAKEFEGVFCGKE